MNILKIVLYLLLVLYSIPALASNLVSLEVPVGIVYLKDSASISESSFTLSSSSIVDTGEFELDPSTGELVPVQVKVPDPELVLVASNDRSWLGFKSDKLAYCMSGSSLVEGSQEIVNVTSADTFMAVGDSAKLSLYCTRLGTGNVTLSIVEVFTNGD